MAQLLKDGLLITVVGMGLVFGALALLWGVMVLMNRIFPQRRLRVQVLGEQPAAQEESGITPLDAVSAAAPGDQPTADELAAAVAALMRWHEEEMTEESIGWRLPPQLTRWMAVGRSRQMRSWTPRQ